MGDDRISSAFRALVNPSRRQLLVGINGESPQNDKDCAKLSIISKEAEPAVSEIELIHDPPSTARRTGLIRL